MITIQKLPTEEFPKLKSIHEGFVPPENSIVLIAKQGSEIVGRVFLMQPTHVEGPWVREDLRGGLVGARLMKEIVEEAKKCGISKVFAYATDEQLEDYLMRLGYTREPWSVWTKEV